MAIPASARNDVYALIAAIPLGSVTTYGHLARAAGIPRNARLVGWWIARSPVDRDLPCHRVVNAEGRLSGGWAFGHPEVMKSMLEAEGIRFTDEYQVDLDRHLWIPETNHPPPTKCTTSS
jgi:methylated-DNA-protein-cysteine methyltransferase-like protein